MLTTLKNLNEKQLVKELISHGVEHEEIKRELKEAKADHRIISPMFKTASRVFVICINWNKKQKYTLMHKAI